MTALPWHSLKLRLPLLTVLLFLGGLWTLALFAHYKLRQDMRSQVEAGHPIGALAGVLDLSHPNFLDSVQQQPYGRSGGFLVVDQRSRTIVAASDRQRIMERLPMADADTAHDALAAATQPQQTQFEHLRNGQPWLVAVRNIPTADWAIVVSKPLPIEALERFLQEHTAV